MLKPWRTFTLAAWTLLGPVRGGEAPLTTFERMDTLYFGKGSVALSPLGLEKLGQFVQAWGKTGPWAIGIPRNHGASEPVVQGRVQALIHALAEQGVVGVVTLATEAVPRDGFDPMLVGKLKADPFAGVDPNEDQPQAPAVQPVEPVLPSAPAPVPAPASEPAPARPKAPVPAPRPSSVPWWAIQGSVETRSSQPAQPPTVRLDAKPSQVLGLGLNLWGDWGQIDLGYSKTAQAEQSEPTNRLDVSTQATTFYRQWRLGAQFKGAWMPIGISYEDETAATTAVLAKNTLIVDRNGFAWVSLMDGVNFAYKRRDQTFALDGQFGRKTQGLKLAVGLQIDKIESPLNVTEFGSYSDHMLFAAKYDLVGVHASLQGDPWREGFHADALELRVGRATGIHVVDQYRLLNVDVAKRPFNEAMLRFAPYYLGFVGRSGFVRITAPLAYTWNSFKPVTVLQANGDGQEVGLYGTRSSFGLKLDLGLRY
ncbi:hypothetical protein GETHLI_23560 [Geothrix limicola]|uniref:Uncharacterized protein n=1 Tax=Geothrix limicola TaxID=2927978 RepID=A0ABQ5QG83_9BACT|nr:hypothetical protein [Geothrix limicola]GLH73854.1 hypothetical protein GETHLI_23560 [Geothrix limicola]